MVSASTSRRSSAAARRLRSDAAAAAGNARRSGADESRADCRAVGYRAGRLPAWAISHSPFLEWNDRYRDDVRRFWRGDRGMIGQLATRLAGSSDVFGRIARQTRSVNFIAAHDGFTLADLSPTSASTTRPMARATATATTRISPGTMASRARPAIRRSWRRAAAT